MFLVMFVLIFIRANASDPPLTLDYYKSTCPRVLDIVRREMECAVFSDPRNAAIIVRLHMHDCFVQVIGSRIAVCYLAYMYLCQTNPYLIINGFRKPKT